MDKNDVEMPKKKVDRTRVVTVSSLLIAAVLFVLDLYLMINKPGSYVVLIVVTLLLLVEIYLFIDAVLQEINKNKEFAEEQYGNLFKSGKASYLLLKKLLEQMETLEKKDAGVSSEEIITAQKAIAKVAISRNKENTDALMNSNDKVMEKIFDFEEKFEANQAEMLGGQKNIIDNFMEELTQKQQEFILSVKEMEASLKAELMETKETISALQEKMADLPEDEPIVSEEKPGMSEIDLMFDSLGMEKDDDISEDALTLDDFDLGESENLLEDEPVSDAPDLGESENLLEDEPVSDTLDLGENTDLPDDDLLFDGIDLGDDVSPMEDEPPIEELVKNVLPEETEEPEETKEKKAEMPDLSDPHKMMTPEEIAALIANM